MSYEATTHPFVAAARGLHQPSVASAGEYEDGSCAYCENRFDLPMIRRYRGHLNGARTKTWMHDHPDSHPVCVTCAAGYDDRAPFPCATALALGWLSDEAPASSGVSV